VLGSSGILRSLGLLRSSFGRCLLLHQTLDVLALSASVVVESFHGLFVLLRTKQKQNLATKDKVAHPNTTYLSRVLKLCL
jgi:hypothetical protein